MTAQALFTLDLNRCTGCSACAVACTIENDVDPALPWRTIHTYNAQHHADTAAFHLSLACNHCADPACMHGCPAAAYTKDPSTGAVLLNREHCIGCGYCAWVCPYDAPQYNRSTGTMEKCTFCSHRLAEDLEPACVTACPVDALGFLRDAEPSPQTVPGFPDSGLRPAIALTPKRGAERPRAREPVREGARLEPRRLRSEWPLLAFSLIVTGMVAWYVTVLLGGAVVHGPGFAAAAVVAMAVSTAHLGRPLRAWRAVLNVRTSWVSREILACSAFWAVGTATALLALPVWLSWVAAALGFGALICIDGVYVVRDQRVPAVPHSAMTSLTALFVIGLAAPVAWLAVLSGVAKVALYPWRAVRAREIPPLLTATRLGLGLLWPAAVAAVVPEAGLGVLLAGPVLGEVVDRTRFYAELQFMSPARRIALDLGEQPLGA